MGGRFLILTSIAERGQGGTCRGERERGGISSTRLGQQERKSLNGGKACPNGEGKWGIHHAGTGSDADGRGIPKKNTASFRRERLTAGGSGGILDHRSP